MGVVICFGQEFPTVKAFADAYELCYSTVRTGLKQGKKPEDLVIYRKTASKKVTCYGERYSSIRSFARLWGLNADWVYHALNNGTTLEDVYDSRQPIVADGIQFNDMKEVSMYYELDYGQLTRLVSIGGKSVGDAIRILQQQSKRLICFGREYETIKDLARDYGLRPGTVARRLGTGMTPEEAVMKDTQRHGSAPIVFGKQYRTLRDVAIVYGYTYATIRYRHRHGYTIEEAVTTNRHGHFCYQCFGKSYDNLLEIEEAFGVNLYAMIEAFRDKQDLEQVIYQAGKAPKGFVVDDVWYANVSKYAEAFDQNPSTVAQRIRNGMTPKRAVYDRRYNDVGERIECFGKEYISIRKLAKTFGLEYSLVLARLKKGATPEEAVMYKAGGRKRITSYKVDNAIMCFGKGYKSLYALEAEYGVSASMLCNRMKMNMTAEAAVSIPVKTFPEVEAFGQVFKNKTALGKWIAEQTGTNFRTILWKMQQGCTPEETLDYYSKK